MKRLIKYWNRYVSDKSRFSDCSTGYELLPEIVGDDAGNVELKALAKKYGIKLSDRAESIELKNRNLEVTHAYKTDKTYNSKFHGKNEPMPVWIGFITIPEGSLQVKSTLKNDVTLEEANEIINGQEYGVDDIGEMVDEKPIIVMRGWDYYHSLEVAGYSLESFRQVFGATKDSENFEDSVFRCSECGSYDYNDSGYTYNYRIVAEYMQLGLNCGCYDNHMKSKDALESFIDNPSQAIERSVLEYHAEKNHVKELGTWIGGLTDPGRGGYIRGQSVSNGDPKSVLADFKKRYPKKKFVFSHDDSGQFQTYFSIWEVKKEHLCIK